MTSQTLKQLPSQFLSLAMYRELEKRATISPLVTALKSHRGTQFEKYEQIVNSEFELADLLEGASQDTFAHIFETSLGGGITCEEFDIWQKLIGLSADLSEQLLGMVRVPRVPSLTALRALRSIRYRSADRRLRILDFQSECPFIAPALTLSGYAVLSTDAHPHMYVLQNLLWNASVDPLFHETALPGPLPLVEMQPGFITHAPCWKILQHSEASHIKADVVVMGAGLLHLERRWLKEFLTFLTENCLSAQANPGMLLIEGAALPPTELQDVVSIFESVGCSLTFCDQTGCAFTLNRAILPDITHAREHDREHQYIPLTQLQTVYALVELRPPEDIDHLPM